MDDQLGTSLETSHASHEAPFVLKAKDSFIVMSSLGDIGGASEGLFIDDTRMLSRLSVRLENQRPVLLSAAISEDNVMFISHQTNPELVLPRQVLLPGTLHLERRCLLYDNQLHIRLALENFGTTAVDLSLQLGWQADFVDMFEIRGQRRMRRGQRSRSEISPRHVTMAYEGLDRQQRRSVISFSQAPDSLTEESANFRLHLAPRERWELVLSVDRKPHRASPDAFMKAERKARRQMHRRTMRGAQLHADNPLFSRWLQRARADLALLTSDLPTGPYPYAGIPWFSTPFGRDAIITALQTLWIDPSLAEGVLRYLAEHQSEETSAFRDAQPGKIMHETRKGEMAAMNELPFARYYGGVDTTPLFIMLAGAWYRRTGDRKGLEQLWPALLAAIRWVEERLEENHAGLLSYQRAEDSGLQNQGWKDSADAVSHADGSLASPPIALLEVQGYAWRALQDMADMSKAIDHSPGLAARWESLAEKLRLQVEERFWMENRQFYGLALDGKDTLCEVEGSNAGHLLWSGLPASDRAYHVIQKLLAPAFNSGWGIRTLSEQEIRYNPGAYHNGSVWPHDVAICAAGMARYGEREGVRQLLDNLFEAALCFSLRLPELFCGFSRTRGEQPVLYPVACQPQAWASGAVFMLLQAALGLEIDATGHCVRIVRPQLPSGVNQLTLRHLQVGGEFISVTFQRMGPRTLAFISEPAQPSVKLHLEC
ncbi:glycogen debranching N-terminal domain-containing protein [Methylobacillus sp.]|uniref:amylo-alpha-1,6-glucosidase n=1 Tax=Methylobacillus sp. TaxID=56818 RepID=UPI0012C15905|nr:glycogen debranching N-terminal domain-containing protein [Methylobacillus sp.]MPS49406.1 amylo-alpha-1,6-glucosidase [Methylobacillus sp.]